MPSFRVQNVFFKQQKYRIKKSPENEIPRCPVPEAGRRPDDKDVKNMPYRLYAVSAEGNIKVVAEPAAEGDVPAAPELRNACG